jgi:hypothetical protein
MKDKKLFNFLLTDEQKSKLFSDASRNGFPTTSSYLIKLIEIGLPLPESLDLRMKLIDKKIDCLTDNVTAFHNRNFTLLEKIFKRIQIVYRVVAYSLARLFHMKSDPVSQDNLDDANAIIQHELDRIEKKYEGKE